TFRTMHYAPIAFITGQTGRNVKALLNHGQMLLKQTRSRVTTGRMNRMIRAALNDNPPPLVRNKRPKIYYATQAAVQPPTLLLFCNDPALISKPYRRYLINMLRDEAPFGEVPIRLYFRRRGAQDRQDDIDRHLQNPT
ncbi:MAG: ribosome biogenesis GTPase Der, partial [Pirellulales bacterium]